MLTPDGEIGEPIRKHTHLETLESILTDKRFNKAADILRAEIDREIVEKLKQALEEHKK